MMAELPKIIHILGGYTVIALDSEKELDKEWMELIKKALELGISIEEIRDFLNK
jgi:Anti-repressor SinI